MRQIVPPVSSAKRSEPFLATAMAAGRPQTSARCSPDAQKPVAKFSYQPSRRRSLNGPHDLAAGRHEAVPRALQHHKQAAVEFGRELVALVINQIEQ
jgi:hypothetical protein